MNWTNITADDLNDTKMAPLVAALGSAALGDGQDDPMSAAISNVVTRIRAEIKGNASNKLDQDVEKIPASLKSLACRMVYRELASRLQMALTDDEKTEQSNDLRYLERIAKGEVPVDQPDNPIEGAVQAVSVSPRISARPRRFSRDQQEGV